MSIFGAQHGIPVSNQIVKVVTMARSEMRKQKRLREEALSQEDTLNDILPSAKEGE